VAGVFGYQQQERQMTYSEILKNRINAGEIDTLDAVEWLQVHGITVTMALALLGEDNE
tara:strand:- start:525 stop:698 length:174 start_codon:yes stop_codon:yes gene_type:complete